MASHAWIEYLGRKTDASLTYTLHPKAQPAGGLIIHDRTIRKGEVDYRYFNNDDPIAIEKLNKLREMADISDVLAQKEEQHLNMLKIVRDGTISEYLSKAPAGLGYSDISRLVENRD